MMYRLVLIAWVLLFLCGGHRGDAVTFEQVQPTPRHAFYDSQRAPFRVVEAGPIVVRFAPAVEGDVARFTEFATRLAPALDLQLRADDAMAAHTVTLSTKPAWKGPQVFPNPPAEAEGYTLHVEPEGIAVAGADAAGVNHGLQTVLQLFLQAYDERAPIPAGRLVDWPAIGERSILLSLRKLQGSDDLAYLQKVLAALAALKYNSVFLEFNSAAPGERFAFPTTALNPVTDDQLHAIRDAARRYRLDVNLYFQFGGHCKWLLDEPAYADLGSAVNEPLSWNNSNWCPLQPMLWDVVEDLVRRQASIFEPRWIHVAHDEMGHGEFGATPLARKSGLSREELIGRSLARTRDAVVAAGSDARLLLWHDLLPPDRYKSSSRVGFVDGAKLLGLVPSEMAIAIWDYDAGDETIALTDYFGKRHGREQWLTTFQAEHAFRVASFAQLEGATGLLSTHWYEAPWCTWNDPKGISAAAMSAVVASAAAAWNPEFDAAGSLVVDRVHLFRQLVEGLPNRSEWSGDWVALTSPRTSDDAGKPADAVVRSWAESMPRQIVSPAGIPFELFANPVAPPAASGASVRIEVGRPVTAVHFLHATDRPNASSGLNSWQEGGTTPHLGDYVLHFSDGKPATIPLRYRWNIQHWNAREGAYHCRVAWAGTLAKGVQAQLTEASWQADNGARHLEAIEFVGKGDASPTPRLWGVTVATPDGRAEQGGGRSRDAVFEDRFEYASTDALRAAWSGFGKGMKHVPRSATSPAHMHITLPATAADAAPVRLDVGQRGLHLDIAEANTLSLNMRSTARPDDAVTMIVYLGSTTPGQPAYYLTYHLPTVGDEWTRITLPLDAARTEGKRPAAGASQFDTLKVSFWHRNARPVDVRISELAIGSYAGPEIFNTATRLPTRSRLPEARGPQQ